MNLSLLPMRNTRQVHLIMLDYFILIVLCQPVPVAARSNEWVCGCLSVEVVSSNSTRDMDVCLLCCMLSGRGLCDDLITRPEESYRLWCVVVCDVETSCMRRPWPHWGDVAHKNK